MCSIVTRGVVLVALLAVVRYLYRRHVSVAYWGDAGNWKVGRVVVWWSSTPDRLIGWYVHGTHDRPFPGRHYRIV